MREIATLVNSLAMTSDSNVIARAFICFSRHCEGEARGNLIQEKSKPTKSYTLQAM